MTFTIHLPDDKEAALKAKAEAAGISAEQYARQVLEEAIEPGRRRHISDVIHEIMSDVPPEMMATMPTDGASEHDHYLYGWAKRNS
jgi:plasmid stability protein